MCLPSGMIGMCIRKAILYMYMENRGNSFVHLLNVHLAKKWNRAEGMCSRAPRQFSSRHNAEASYRVSGDRDKT